jgi:hypothetical protein
MNAKVSFWLGLFSTFYDIVAVSFFIHAFKKEFTAKNRKIALFGFDSNPCSIISWYYFYLFLQTDLT